ncbi:hypothetical protein F0M37_23605 [Salmonella enterica subsp. enterica]|nr:hypothetical protein [Salmonella enterica subsp. enterica serovar Manchester]ECD3769617.1 hypothetical protein [Salmonella enterica subsp. enterica serovar Onderstepoort]ECO0045253.1 hypothetical protein [Salmonella enterica subsp. enterica serovar Infantis]ECR1919544.1 hypothetical protein [Salmonella enterica subsp. enterica serovar Johannesburg]EEA7773538.1 hypothetical protein [Salmonella enterica subsp. enterica serovar Manchester]
MRLTMEFKDLPADLQVIAADCLRQKLAGIDSTQKEPAITQAQSIKAAFIELYSPAPDVAPQHGNG